MYRSHETEIVLKGVMHITLSDVGSICSIIGLLFALYVYIFPYKKKK